MQDQARYKDILILNISVHDRDQARECKKYVVDAEYRVRGFLKQTNSQGVVILSFY
ncbi:8583_t:CDS:2 [Entrophospora sp. SA101]|nr:8583_t:CDS:2 [Entrophospora sp. SA101]